MAQFYKALNIDRSALIDYLDTGWLKDILWPERQPPIKKSFLNFDGKADRKIEKNKQSKKRGRL